MRYHQCVVNIVFVAHVMAVMEANFDDGVGVDF
jgi:hypothetical protein